MPNANPDTLLPARRLLARSAEPRREGDAPPPRLTDAVHPRVTKILEALSELRNHPQLRHILPNGLCWRIEEQALRLNGCLVEQAKVIREQHQTFVNDQAQLATMEERIERLAPAGGRSC